MEQVLLTTSQFKMMLLLILALGSFIGWLLNEFVTELRKEDE